MPAITVTNATTVTIVVDGQDKAEKLHRVLNYGINNMPSGELPTGDDLSEINNVITQLASVFD